MFTGWVEWINRKLKSQILVGASSFCWAIWLTRNDIVFDKVVAPSFAGYLQEYLLDQVLVPVTKGGSPFSEDGGEGGVHDH